MAEKDFSDTEKLRKLLGHWLQHNESHAEEYLKWAEIARQAGNNDAAEQIGQAIEHQKKTDESLKKALDSVGGPSDEHHHHHHHDHD